jgi:hypothetical protein
MLPRQKLVGGSSVDADVRARPRSACEYALRSTSFQALPYQAHRRMTLPFGFVVSTSEHDSACIVSRL